ncbi:hypothetical protein CHS0354_024896 [Potamilus streckersoni]|uniref:Uncharacterized protein n=1 Tax=Potamilus streckersoni TaxID=2493646 RepID=A0AAE0TFB4_9BIVA|nr:hypothetical protein CHS0354_024896 [Potamilus streckersoni]
MKTMLRREKPQHGDRREMGTVSYLLRYVKFGQSDDMFCDIWSFRFLPLIYRKNELSQSNPFLINMAHVAPFLPDVLYKQEISNINPSECFNPPDGYHQNISGLYGCISYYNANPKQITNVTPNLQIKLTVQMHGNIQNEIHADLSRTDDEDINQDRLTR